ncbi:MAG: Gfo/Idh/MocA family oxidoreductase [Pirellulaceae bacterium]
MNARSSRRDFLRSSALLGAGLTILPAGVVHSYRANEKINVALVGVGGRGTWFVDTIPRLEKVVAVCDVNASKIADAFRYWDEFGKKYAVSEHSWERSAATEYQHLAQRPPKAFSDFRRMLDEMGQEIDAVVIATPDHTHAIVSAAAIKAGKHVFCEKPLTRTVDESRKLRELARQHKVATAMGNQGTYSGAFRRALELIRNGTLGDIQEVFVWNSGGGADRKEPPKGEQPLPEGLEWDLWLGPAADRPFHSEWMQRHLWREFGTCQLGNWASHSANLGFMALKVHDLWSPHNGEASNPVVRIQAECPAINPLSFPSWEVVRWDVPARAEFPPIRITWHNGQTPGVEAILDRAIEGGPPREKNNWRFAGTLIVGTKGAIHTTGHNMSFRLLPEDQFTDVQRERPESVENSRGPEQDWFAAIRGGKPGWSNFDYASALNEFLMLGNVATQFEETLEFEPAAMKIVNNAAADALLRCEYRQGWSL